MRQPSWLLTTKQISTWIPRIPTTYSNLPETHPWLCLEYQIGIITTGRENYYYRTQKSPHHISKFCIPRLPIKTMRLFRDSNPGPNRNVIFTVSHLFVLHSKCTVHSKTCFSHFSRQIQRIWAWYFGLRVFSAYPAWPSATCNIVQY